MDITQILSKETLAEKDMKQLFSSCKLFQNKKSGIRITNYLLKELKIDPKELYTQQKSIADHVAYIESIKLKMPKLLKKLNLRNIMSILQDPQYDEGRASDIKEITKKKKTKKLKGGRKSKRKKPKRTNKLPHSSQQPINEKELKQVFDKLLLLCTTRTYPVFKKQIKELHTTIHNYRKQKKMTSKKLQNFLETKPIFELLKILIANGYGRQ